MYQRILVPVDDSATARRGLQEAIHLALMSKGCIRLVLVLDELRVGARDSEDNVNDTDTDTDTDTDNETETETETETESGTVQAGAQAGGDFMEACLAQVALAGVECDVALRKGLSGKIPETIAMEAEAWRADIVVLGTLARQGLARLAFGSNGDAILHFSQVPVLQVRL